MSSSIYNFFRDLFSLQPNSSSGGSSNLPDHHVNGFRDPIWDTYETDESDVESRLPHGSMFSIYSNPLEIHRFFESRFDEMEQKMNEMMRDSGGIFKHFGMPAYPPALEEPPAPALEPSNKNIRDALLKPGFRSGSSTDERVDSDLDGRIASEEIGSLLDKKRRSDIATVPLHPSSPSGGFASFSSYITRTVRHPDGVNELQEYESRTFTELRPVVDTCTTKAISDNIECEQQNPIAAREVEDGISYYGCTYDTIEREDIVRDGAGNEKRTVTQKRPNGEETSVTTETPASGDPIMPNCSPRGSRWWNW